MKTKYLIIIFAVVTISVLKLTGCNGNKREKEAGLYLDEARNHYQNKNYKAANDKIDSLFIKYPNAYNSKSKAEWLKDSVKRSMAYDTLDILSNQINELKIQLITLQNKEDNLIKQKMDSLENLKNPLRNIINEITNKELKHAARTQCVTCIR